MSGYSFLELLVAMGLIGVISFTAVPVASQYLAQYQLTSAASQLGFQISRARMQAIGQHAFIRIRFIAPNQYVRELSSDGGSTYTQNGVAVTLPTGITTSGTPGVPSFNVSGLATNGVTSITLTGPSGRKTVQTNTIGRVTVS